MAGSLSGLSDPNSTGGALLAFANPRVASALSQMKSNNIVQQSAAMDLQNKKYQQNQLYDAGLGPSATGQTNPRGSWDPNMFPGAKPDYQNDPIGATMSDPTMNLAMQLNPQGVLSGIMARAMAPPVSVRLTDKDGNVTQQMLPPSAIMARQAQGYQVEELDKAKPVDQNQAPTTYKLPGPNNREQTYMWRPGMGSPSPVGTPGAPIITPQSEAGKEDFDSRNRSLWQSGGTMVPGQRGSGSPPVGAVSTPPPANGSGAGSASGFQAPVYDPVAATDNSPARRPWLQQPAIGAGQNYTQPSMPGAPMPGALPGGLSQADLNDPYKLAENTRRLNLIKLGAETDALTNKTAFNNIPSNLTGEDAYNWAENNLPQGREIASMARAVASGAQKQPPIGRPGSIGEQVQALVSRAEGPNVDLGQRYRTAQEYSQAGTTGKAIRSIDTTLYHTNRMLNAFGDLNNGRFPLWNSIGNTAEQATGSGAPGAFSTNRDAVASEARKVFAGANGGGITELNEWKDNLPQNASPEQMQRSAGALQELLKGRLDPLIWNYNQTMGTNKKLEDFMSPGSIKIWNRLQQTAQGGPGAARTLPNGQLGPQPGDTEGGYRFNGGDPGNRANWEAVR